jgi:hypothetical protein
MFGRPPTNFGPPGPFPGPGQFPPFHMQPPRTGGILSRLFGGGSKPGIGGIGGFPGSNILGMMNPGGGGGQGFLGTMQNIEKMIQLAQTVKPMIDQYGPMVKNIPSMLNLLKEYKTYSADQEQSNTNTLTVSDTKKLPSATQNNTSKQTSLNELNKIAPTQSNNGIKVVPRTKPTNSNKSIKKAEYKVSTPKLYI